MTYYRILLADDHAMFRYGIRRILEEESGWQVVGEAQDGIELIQLVKRERPDLIIVDLSMPHFAGVEAAAELRRLHPYLRILILTMHKEKEYLIKAISAGASGYLVKEDSFTELISAVKAVQGGGTYISPSVSDEMVQLITEKDNKPLEDPLSLREKQVLTLIAEGKASKEIADLLFISVRTVHNHRANIMRKLHIKKGAELIKYAIRHGYVPSP